MPTVVRDVSVPFAPKQMFDLVNDVESYPDFLPWCDGATVQSREGDVTRASLLLSRSGVQSRFSTRNTAVPHARIDIELLNGPFDHLRGRWTFEGSADASRVRLELRYQFRNPLMSFVLSAVVEDIATELVAAFRQRARDIYVG